MHMPKIVSTLAAVLFCGSLCFAILPMDDGLANTGPETRYLPVPRLDAQCVIDFTGYGFGTSAGITTWPGGNGDFRLTQFCFTNSCTPGTPFCAFCFDLQNLLFRDPYCVNIDSVHVRAQFPAQYPAISYLFAWYPIPNALEERIMQVALWKLSNENNFNSPNFGIPYYYINDGRGYPNLGDTPVFPYVNTVYNSDPTVNDPANTRVLFALGTTDGIAKNVLVVGDQILLSWDPVVIVGPNAEITVHALVLRGARALSVGNTSVAGIRLLFNNDNGQISATDLVTDASGEAEVTITQPRDNPLQVILTVCTHSVWPVVATGCNLIWPVQRLISGDVDTVCTSVTIPPDSFLAVELSSFDAVPSSGGIQLTWRTASESNLDRWEVERAVGASAYTTLTSVAASNSATGHSYSYLDATAQRAVVYRYRLVDVDINGRRTAHDDLVRTASLPVDGIAPLTFFLANNYPNPFNPETTIRFGLAEDSHVSLKIFDVTGSEIATLIDGFLHADEHAITFDAHALPSGVYFYTLTAGNFSATRKMMLLK